MTEVCVDGSNYGDVVISKDNVVLRSFNGREMLDVKLQQVSQCVVPGSNRDDLEIHMVEDERQSKDEDALAQITFHFPPNDEEIDETKAEEFRKLIFETGQLRSVSGDIIVEFTKDQGNFVTPRGKYSIQMLASSMQMQGVQYSYRIKYEDIQSLFLLPKPDGSRMAFVISLEKPIRQGNQKYQHLIIETHKIENTITVNLTEEELKEKYDGQLTKEMTAPLSTLFAKIFKVLSQTTVFVPKHFISSRESNAIKCSLKANDGLLYPLAKSFIFIHKPTVIIKFEDVESIEFQRYDPTVISGARNFDLVVTLKGGTAYDAREYTFASIDRSEYNPLHDFIEARNLKIIENALPRAATFEGLDGDGDEDESDDDDYVEGNSKASDESESASEDDEQEERGKKRRKKSKDSEDN